MTTVGYDDHEVLVLAVVFSIISDEPPAISHENINSFRGNKKHLRVEKDVRVGLKRGSAAIESKEVYVKSPSVSEAIFNSTFSIHNPITFEVLRGVFSIEFEEI